MSRALASRRPPNNIARCARCFLKPQLCLCAVIPSVPTRLHVLLVRHALEFHRPSNTARLAHLALPNSTLLEHGGTRATPPVHQHLHAHAVLLFPGGVPLRSLTTPPTQLVVVDGTWSQARKMVQRLAPLAALPRVSLEAAPPGQRLRQPPHPDGMSTLEAVALALTTLETADAGEALLQLHRCLVERVMRSRSGRPALSIMAAPD